MDIERTIPTKKEYEELVKQAEEGSSGGSTRARGVAMAESSIQAAFAPQPVSAPNNTDRLDISRQEVSSETTIKLAGLQEFFNMRKRWSGVLMGALFIILVFNVVLVVFVGTGHLDYNDDWFLRLVLTTNLADIIGLIYLVVKFLFQNPPA